MLPFLRRQGYHHGMETQHNMIGAYGQWAAGLIQSKLPKLSFRNAKFNDIQAWRKLARRAALKHLAAPKARARRIKVIETRQEDGLHIERLTWQLPYGPATEAVLLKPAGVTGPLPGVLALHCHGGRKWLGWRKIARCGAIDPMIAQHQEQFYGGRAWANELARRGYVVLAHDAFAFASRRVRVADCQTDIRWDNAADPADESDTQAITAYNAWSAKHEHVMAKSLFCAGTTWPGVFFAEDRSALDVLAGRSDVDPKRLGCGGLSGGGLRTDMLAGLDERIRCSVTAGYMSTWRDFLLYKCHMHSWMGFVPLLPGELDFPEILGLRVPDATMVLNTTDDTLYTQEEVKLSQAILQEVFAKAGASDRLDFRHYPGQHKFDAPMQDDAFAWFDRWLKS